MPEWWSLMESESRNSSSSLVQYAESSKRLGGRREPDLLLNFLSFIKPRHQDGLNDEEAKMTSQDAEKRMRTTSDCNMLLLLLGMFPELVKLDLFDSLWTLIKPLLKALNEKDEKSSSHSHSTVLTTDEEVNKNCNCPPKAILHCPISCNNCGDIIMKSACRFTSIHWPQHDNVKSHVNLVNSDALIVVFGSNTSEVKLSIDVAGRAMAHSVPVIGVRDGSYALRNGHTQHQKKLKFRCSLASQHGATKSSRTVENVYSEALVYSPKYIDDFISKLKGRLSDLLHNRGSKHLNEDITNSQIQNLPNPLLAIIGNNMAKTKNNIPCVRYGTTNESTLIRRPVKRDSRDLKPKQFHLPPLDNSDFLITTQIPRSSSYNEVRRDDSPIETSPPQVNQIHSDPEDERLSQMFTFDNSFLVVKKPGAKPEVIKWPLKDVRRESIMTSGLDEESEVSIPLDVVCPTDLDTESLISDSDISESLSQP